MFAVGEALAYPQDFLRADKTVAWDEGGYQSAAQAEANGDPGGETKYGICKLWFVDENLADLTPERAQRLRYEKFWVPFHFDQLPIPIDRKVYNLGINVGPANAVICLQRALRACGKDLAEDGVIGPLTAACAAAAATSNSEALLNALRSEAAGHYRFARALWRVQNQMKQATSFSAIQRDSIESALRDEDRDQLLGGLLKRAYE